MSTENKVVRMTLRLSKDENERLEQYAKAKRLTKTGGIRQLLELALFADEVLSLEADTAFVEQAHGIVAEQLFEITNIAKRTSVNLTPEDKYALMAAMSKNRDKMDSYVRELNRIGTNINQIAKKFNALDSIDGNEIVSGIEHINGSIRGMRDLVNETNEAVDKIWRTVQ